MIPQRPSKNPNLSAKPDVKQPLQILTLTMIDPSTHLLELIFVPDKESRTMACAFNRSWLCRYPRPLICLHDKACRTVSSIEKRLFFSLKAYWRLFQVTLLGRDRALSLPRLSSTKDMALML
jgi:hypothetical protein